MKIYHIYSKSIAGYRIFRTAVDYERFVGLIQYYVFAQEYCYSYYLHNKKDPILYMERDEKKKLVDILAYCIMPTHVHLLLGDCQEDETGISKYMRIVLDGYSRYFNPLYKRKGPLWQSRFQRNEIPSDDVLAHVSRYIHLNPVTAGLVALPEEWRASSYFEYIGRIPEASFFCSFQEYIPDCEYDYKEFVESGIGDQREYARMKALLSDDDD